MGLVTYFVALPFARTEEGEIVAGEAKELRTAIAAVREAQQMAIAAVGRHHRTGDPASGEFEDAVVIERFGDVDLAALMKGA